MHAAYILSPDRVQNILSTRTPDAVSCPNSIMVNIIMCSAHTHLAAYPAKRPHTQRHPAVAVLAEFEVLFSGPANSQQHSVQFSVLLPSDQTQVNSQQHESLDAIHAGLSCWQPLLSHAALNRYICTVAAKHAFH